MNHMKNRYKIALNALSLKDNSGGIEASYYNTVKYILKNDTQNKYFLFIGKNAKNIFADFKDYKNLEIIVFPINTNNSKIRVVVEYTLSNLFILLHRIDLIHHLCDYMPRLNCCKTITTIHDLSGFFYHENYPPTKMMEYYYKYTKTETAYTLKLCDRIIAVSDFTKQELNKYYPEIDIQDKTVIIGQSIDSRKKYFKPNSNFLNELNIRNPYIFTTSIIRPHKNYEFLIKTFNKLKEKYNIPHQLVIAGGMGNEMKQREYNSFLYEIEQSPFKQDIKYLGYVDNKYMSTLYTYADIYTTATIYEGFGLPILEAMMYKKPIACSWAASLPQVGGDGCIYFDPFNIDNAADTINKLLLDKVLQKKLIEQQKKQLDLYEWNNIAQQILQQYYLLLKNNKLVDVVNAQSYREKL